MPHQRFELKSFTAANGVTLRYREQGTGAPLILLHNAGTDHVIWRHQIQDFGLTHRVIAIDLPGAGLSERPDTPYTLDYLVSFLEEFIAREKIERPILAGNCVGASACLAYSLRHPEAASALVLFNVFEGSRTAPSLMLVESGWVPAGPGARLLGKLSIPFFLWGKRPSRDDFIYRHYLDVTLRHPLNEQSRRNFLLGASSFNHLTFGLVKPAHFPPTLLLWGARNRVLSPRRGRALARRLAPDHFVEIPDGGHLAMAECPRFVNSVMRDFIAEPAVQARLPAAARRARPHLQLVRG